MEFEILISRAALREIAVATDHGTYLVRTGVEVVLPPQVVSEIVQLFQDMPSDEELPETYSILIQSDEIETEY
jgi:hypothetical protein